MTSVLTEIATMDPAVVGRVATDPARSSALAPGLVVRPARARDATALYGLSRPFAVSGALRERPPELYATDAADFLVVEAPGPGGLLGCLALREHPSAPLGPSGVLYNFCVAPEGQGRGIGSALLAAALRAAGTRELRAVFTATSGSGSLFMTHGFAPTALRLAPPAWARALDPRRGSRVLARRSGTLSG
ncbi:GNAT family N-acetyltransferase [Streptomyces sp. NPDC000594]|uniref:GNAT family N-acetyltransferase n=1 Tax=Streptomyces sp. NPDC000594 TaxID=3154261 RepID=UPI00332B85CC